MKVVNRNNKDYILCPWRRRWVRLTPEEWVRQQFLRRLVEEYHYPEALIGVEVPLATILPAISSDTPPLLGGAGGGLRLDAIVMDDAFRPQILIEFKREGVALSQKVLDQASVYNRALHVPLLILSNGPETLVARVLENSYEYLDTIPEWNA